MTSIWEEWPELLQTVRVSKRFSASALASPFQCPIQSFGKADDLPGAMGPGIPSLIGSAIHTLLQRGSLQHTRGVRDQIVLLESVINESLTRFQPAQRRDILPLDGQYRTVAARSLASASMWAVTAKKDEKEAGRMCLPNYETCQDNQSRRSQMQREIRTSFLVEEPLASHRWRLEGRADLIRIESNYIEIIDFKSGRTVGDGGKLLNSIVLQMNAYALMASERWPDHQIRLRVLGQEDLELRADSETQKVVKELVRELETSFPSGRELITVESARTSPGCRYCRLRTVCITYLKGAAREWARLMPRRERTSTNDVWGRYLGRDNRFNAILVELQEGRKAKVFGLLPVEIDELTPGSHVGIFGCETQDQLSWNRTSHHPINWRIRNSGRLVPGVRLFSGPRDALHNPGGSNITPQDSWQLLD